MVEHTPHHGSHILSQLPCLHMMHDVASLIIINYTIISPTLIMLLLQPCHICPLAYGLLVPLCIVIPCACAVSACHGSDDIVNYPPIVPRYYYIIIIIAITHT